MFLIGIPDPEVLCHLFRIRNSSSRSIDPEETESMPLADIVIPVEEIDHMLGQLDKSLETELLACLAEGALGDFLLRDVAPTDYLKKTVQFVLNGAFDEI